MFPWESVAMAQGPGGGAGPNAMIQFIPFILIFVVFYFLIIRPQQKKQKSHQNMLADLKKGDQVVTTGGIFGTIFKLGDDSVTLEVSDKVRIKIERQQIGRLVQELSEKKNTEEKAEKIEKIEKIEN
ncbi:MAG: preprotein translocase subunit YajC [SAR324 cluster bacterium]|nr:preprotein translocase subunit YajC [SAR324 cluster bacterium]